MSFSNFCVMPWINLSTDVNGSLRPCCKFAQPNPKNEFQLPNMREGNLQELWNDERFLALRQAFLDNKKPKECQSCWDEEAAGILSFRKNFVRNKKLSLAGINFSDTFSKSPITLDLKLNNVCNLKCRICGAQASSTFVKEFQERLNVELPDAKYWVSNKILGNENEEILTNWAPNIRHIEMTGGEPMVSPENLKVLELLIQSGAEKNITLMLNTNATQYNIKFIDLLKQFKQVKLCLSIDDIGDRLEYERYPTEWHVIQNNIEKFMILQNTHNNIFINVVPTVSIFNVYYLTDYLEWVSNYNFSYLYFNILHYDPFFSIKNLPQPIKNILNNKLTDQRFAPVINFLNLEGDPEIFRKDFFNQVKILDDYRGQSFEETFSEWHFILKNYGN